MRGISPPPQYFVFLGPQEVILENISFSGKNMVQLIVLDILSLCLNVGHLVIFFKEECDSAS